MQFKFTSPNEKQLVVSTNDRSFHYSLDQTNIDVSDLVVYLGSLNEEVSIDVSEIKLLIDDNHRSQDFRSLCLCIHKVFELYGEAFNQVYATN